jgi:hypothetical protein
MEGNRNAYVILVGKPGGNCPFRRHRRELEANIKMDLKEIGLGGGGLDRNKWLDSCEHDDEPSGSIKFGECLDQLRN